MPIRLLILIRETHAPRIVHWLAPIAEVPCVCIYIIRDVKSGQTFLLLLLLFVLVVFKSICVFERCLITSAVSDLWRRLQNRSFGGKHEKLLRKGEVDAKHYRWQEMEGRSPTPPLLLVNTSRFCGYINILSANLSVHSQTNVIVYKWMPCNGKVGRLLSLSNDTSYHVYPSWHYLCYWYSTPI